MHENKMKHRVHTFYFMPRLLMQACQPHTERKACKKYFLVVKLTQYFVREVDRKLTSNCNQEILILKLGKRFTQTSGFVLGRQNR